MKGKVDVEITPCFTDNSICERDKGYRGQIWAQFYHSFESWIEYNSWIFNHAVFVIDSNRYFSIDFKRSKSRLCDIS